MFSHLQFNSPIIRMTQMYLHRLNATNTLLICNFHFKQKHIFDIQIITFSSKNKMKLVPFDLI